MAKKNAKYDKMSNDQKLDYLFSLVIDSIVKNIELNKGDTEPTVLNAAIKLLRDNGINSSSDLIHPEKIDKIKETMTEDDFAQIATSISELNT